MADLQRAHGSQSWLHSVVEATTCSQSYGLQASLLLRTPHNRWLLQPKARFHASSLVASAILQYAPLEFAYTLTPARACATLRCF